MNIDYGKIIKRSWEVTWNNKWLWVMGLVLAVFGGAGSSGGSGGGSGSSSASSTPRPSTTPGPVLNNVKDQTTNVLGQATNALMGWFSNIPIQNWIFLMLIILAFIFFTTAVVWVISSWAKGALIFGFDEADAGKSVTLKSVSPKGISKIKDLIVFRLISTGLTLAMILGLGIIFGLGFLVKMALPVIGIIWLVLFGFVGILSFVIALILFVMLSVYAERLIVLKNYAPWNAWKKGLSLARTNVFPTISMGVINSAIGCGVGCFGILGLIVIFGIPAFLLIAPMFKNGFTFPSIGQIIGLIVLGILFFSLNTLIRGVFVVFNYGNWNLFFKEVFKETANE